MTAQPPSPVRRRRRFRLTGMEMLGFIDTPGTATGPPSRIVEIPVPVTVASGPALAETTEMVEKSDPFADWKPAEFGARLTKGRVRWGLLLPMLLLLAGISAVAVWVYQLPRAEAAQARAALEQNAADMTPRIEALVAVSATLGSPSMDNAVANTALFDLEAGTRSLLAAAGRLPATDVEVRSLATGISSGVAEAQRLFTEAFAYRNAVIPVLAAPDVQIDPTLTDVDEAARLFAEWEARFDNVRMSLPEEVAADVTTRLNVISASLPNLQQSYLDAIGTGDGEGAAGAISVLERALTEAANLLFRLLREVGSVVTDMLNESLLELESLSALFD